ncbi:AAEL011032-PA [Aedes aegypti]|uniref:AAEL011032-PA n=2 Tax=Aedes aegypti TaxID=7159 RepID=A0A1S4FSH4_AEDAE|nr:uncharacterized protein LOC5574259 [Aedes aegypti]EAT36926.1 AAEL011032-PA [Aedes aegypti]
MNRFIAALAFLAVVQALSIDDRTLDVNINVEKNSNSYFHSKLNEGSFQYGLDVEKPVDHHFQHKVKGPDGVTYGCYGFVDPDGKPHLTHYVSDVKGYRVLAPESATKIYIGRLEKSIDNIYQASQAKDVQWKDLFFPPACRTLYADLLKNSPTTARPATPRPTPVRTTPAPIPFEPDFGGSNVHESIVPHDNAPCSQVCTDLKSELQEIKSKLKTLIDSLAQNESKQKFTGSAGGNQTYAYFPVMLSNSVPGGATPGQIAMPAFQCGRQ